MASTIIFGLIFSTLTTLIIVPSFYGLLYDKTRRLARRQRRRERRAARKGRSVETADDSREQQGA